MEGVAILIFLFLLSNHFAYSDLELNKCIPTECGGINITHPFYDAGQDSSCGFPGFQVSCIKSTPLLHLSSNTYIINKISYTDRTFWVVNSVFSPSSFLCTHISQLHNLNLPDTTLTFPSKPAYIVLLQGCSPQQLKRLSNYTTINCTTNSNTNTYNSIVGVYSQLSNWNNLGCTGSVSVPIIPSAEGQIQDRIRDGFPLEWVISTKCQSCQISGGKCVYDQSDTLDSSCSCFDEKGGSDSGVSISNCNSETPMPENGVIYGVLIPLFFLASIAKCLGICCCIISLTKPYSPSGSKPSIFKSAGKGVKKIKRTIRGNKMVTEFLRSQGSGAPKRYSYKEIKKMTMSFKEKVGEGGICVVYKGKLLNGSLVAVKLIKKTKSDGRDFIDKLASINRTNHVNVVNFLGFFFEDRNRGLVYEFMPNGSLEKLPRALSWEPLFQIAVGIARGLEHLHTGCITRTTHFHINRHNILLGENSWPKISDFGLARRGAIPEAFYRHFVDVSHKNDVNSYGLIVLEVIGCRENENADYVHEQVNLVDEEKDLRRKLRMVSLWCIQAIPSSRPSMKEVLQMLEGRLEAIPDPPVPIFCSPPRPQIDQSGSSTVGDSTGHELMGSGNQQNYFSVMRSLEFPPEYQGYNRESLPIAGFSFPAMVSRMKGPNQ